MGLSGIAGEPDAALPFGKNSRIAHEARAIVEVTLPGYCGIRLDPRLPNQSCARAKSNGSGAVRGSDVRPGAEIRLRSTYTSRPRLHPLADQTRLSPTTETRWLGLSELPDPVVIGNAKKCQPPQHHAFQTANTVGPYLTPSDRWNGGPDAQAQSRCPVRHV